MTGQNICAIINPDPLGAVSLPSPAGFTAACRPVDFLCCASACSTGELSDLEAVNAEGLQDEIAAMRIFIRRFIASSAQGAALAPCPDLVFLDAMGLAATRLACLLKTQKLLDRQSPQASDDLGQALAEVIKELGLQHLSKPV